MEQVKIIIERTDDLYSAYAENVEGVYGGGDTVDEALQSVMETIRLIKEYNTPENVPDVLKGDHGVVYKFDTVSLLSYYKGIFTNAALERITGINQKQLQHYASGLKKPRKPQAEKIENALHNLGKELLAVHL
ncbi:type II toxin-antitoxin system HicB family antitoxin [Pontibacter sp. HSC-14F20]|uniref:type II toxin-antitoxin system HicB family antitoxin n=1 Tax=Pontibacter sp. HSC-14F20 TaxID=2864136 RepID=UPI001C72D382|nr:type II toxin-antitoxin system HicB family antitoxin [Pontibacter sp. HSC-14F20]MBX0332586.1 type II toxin-antitoxin system HicB family antitoxin [Pontibacter sp. HSC-14F20]